MAVSDLHTLFQVTFIFPIFGFCNSKKATLGQRSTMIRAVVSLCKITDAEKKYIFNILPCC